jgi:hypothetical protein
MELWLVDRDSYKVEAFEKEFKGVPNVFVRVVNLLELAEDTILTPVNGFGFMDGVLTVNT